MNNELDKKIIEKIDIDNPELDLDGQPKLNKKSIKVALIGFGGLVLIAFVFAFSPPTEKTTKEKEEKYKYDQAMPNSLEVSGKDYLTAISDDNNTELPSLNGNPQIYTTENGSSKTTYKESVVYDRNGNKIETVSYSTDNPYPNNTNNTTSNQNNGYGSFDREPVLKPRTYNAFSPNNNSNPNYVPPVNPQTVYPNNPTNNQQSREQVADDLARKSGLYFKVNSVNGFSDNNSSSNLQLEALALQAEANMTTDAMLQNQQKQKKQFFEEREASFENYLETVYITSIDPSHEVKAGTMIPITMLTGINSDLPGQIIAQVTAPVYDSLTGMNILIPAGSRVIGSYDSSVAFGQNRVLVAWDRILRPDGVSINLRGMKGVDVSGYAGMTDYVDNHLDEIAAAVGLSTAFDTAVNAGIALLSSNQFLESISAVLDTEDVDEDTSEIVEKYFEKAVNQQPTIKIRAGIRGAILVGKDIILPNIQTNF